MLLLWDKYFQSLDSIEVFSLTTEVLKYFPLQQYGKISVVYCGKTGEGHKNGTG